MELVINGQSRILEGVETISDVINHFGLNEKIIVVEHNMEIVPRGQYGEQKVKQGDRIEIVHFVGGGK